MGEWTSHCFHIEMFTSSDRLGLTSECYIEVEQKGGQPPLAYAPKTLLLFYLCFTQSFAFVYFFF